MIHTQQALILSTILSQAAETTVDDITMLSIDSDHNVKYIKDWDFHYVDFDECFFLIDAIDNLDDMLVDGTPAETKLHILTQHFWYDVN